MEPDTTNFLYKLSSIRQSAFSFLESEMKRAGVRDLPPSFGDILYIIHNQGPCYVKDIAALSYKDKSTVSNSINLLENKGYVQKLRDADDGRRVQVRLTPKAEGYIDSMTDISVQLKQKIFNNMSDEEQQILFLLLGKIEKI